MQATVDRWIEALLSGRYVQGGGRLSRWDEDLDRRVHCVMGVLVDLDFQLQTAIGLDQDPMTEFPAWHSAGRITASGEERLRQLGVGWLVDERCPMKDDEGSSTTPMSRLISENDDGVPFADLVELIRELAPEAEAA